MNFISHFSESDKVTYEEFFRWMDIDSNAESLGLSRWLLFPNPNLSLVNKTDTPTFYQTLAGVTHLEELEVVELEKRFWELAGHSPSNQIDLVTISPMISPPLPATLVAPFFEALDENEDGHIDFKELSCGMSAACRGPEMERQKCKKYRKSLIRSRFLDTIERFLMRCCINFYLKRALVRTGSRDSLKLSILRLHIFEPITFGTLCFAIS